MRPAARIRHQVAQARMMALYSRRALLKAGLAAVDALGEGSVRALAEVAELALQTAAALEV